MDENQNPAPKSALNPAKGVGQLVAAVVLAEGIWGFLASLTSNLVVPLLARVMGGDPQSPLYLGKGEETVRSYVTRRYVSSFIPTDETPRQKKHAS